MLDEIGGVADNTRNQDLPGGEFHVAQTLNSVKKRLPTFLDTRAMRLEAS